MGNSSCVQGTPSAEKDSNATIIHCGEATTKILRKSTSFNAAVTMIDLVNVMFDTDDTGANMTEDEMWNLFDSVDTNKDGYWSKSEMVAALVVLGTMGTITYSLSQIMACIPDEANMPFDEVKLLLRDHCEARENTQDSAAHEAATRLSCRKSNRQSIRQSVTHTNIEMQRIRHSGLGRHAGRNSFSFESQGPDAGMLMGKMIIDLYGCEQLTEAFLEEKFNAMDTKKQGYISQGDLRTALLSSLEVSCDECNAFIESMPGSAMNFEDFQEAVAKWLNFEVTDALEVAQENGHSEIIILDTEGLPYGFEQILYPLEEEVGVKGRAKYAIYEDLSTESELWRVHAIVRKGPTSKGCLQFPKAWRGLEEGALISATGIPEIASVSDDGCSATTTSKESAIAMAELSVASMLNRHSVIDIQAQAYPSEVLADCGDDSEDEEDSNETTV